MEPLRSHYSLSFFISGMSAIALLLEHLSLHRTKKYKTVVDIDYLFAKICVNERKY